MPHEIQQNDNILLHRERAWHGMGTIIEENMKPTQAVREISLDWENVPCEIVARFPVSTDEDERGYVELAIDEMLANFRGDDRSFLGCVSKNWKAVQNVEMAEFCEALSETEVHVETIGSLRGGRMVWFLLKGSAFEIGNGDQVWPYVLVSNGHDGKSSFRVTPSTIRTVCANTLHMVIPRTDSGKLGGSAITIVHTQSVMDRVAEAQRALRHYNHTLNKQRELFSDLQRKEVNTSKMREFFYQAYSADFGEIPTNPQNKKEENSRQRAFEALGSFTRRFDDEKELAGTSYWNAFNAYSGLIQHDRKARGQDDADRVTKRIESNLFGLNRDRTINAFKLACTIAL